VSVLRRLVDRFTGDGTPPGFAGRLDAQENVVAVGELRGGGHLVATSLGLWVPADSDTGARRVGWHLISKVTWDNGELVLIEATETGDAGGAVLLADLAPRRFVLATPGKLPQVVHARVTGSIRSRHHRDLPDGGAWFVQRKVAGRDGIVLQVRPDAGTDPAVVRAVAGEVAERIREARGDG
jgi:hypothetical protein